MIYLDTSVALAALLAEDVRPPGNLWSEPLFSSRLIEYEVWTRLHASGHDKTHAVAARSLLQRLNLVELSQEPLRRALEPFPLPVRTLDALHLASFEFLRQKKVPVTLATYDKRMLAVAERMGLPLYAGMQ